MLVIGVVGKKGAGKTAMTQAMEEITAGRNIYCVAFGDALKQMLINAGMVTYDQVYRRKTGLSRWLMQKIGTDIFRNQIDPWFWVKRTKARLREIAESEPEAIVIIHDVRFPEEADLVTKSFNGYLVRVWRPLTRWQYWMQRLREFKGASDHASEKAQDAIHTDLTVCNNKTLKDLHRSGKEVFSIFYERYEMDSEARKRRLEAMRNVPTGEGTKFLLHLNNDKGEKVCQDVAPIAEK